MQNQFVQINKVLKSLATPCLKYPQLPGYGRENISGTLNGKNYTEIKAN